MYQYYGDRYVNIVPSDDIIDVELGKVLPTVIINGSPCVYMTSKDGKSRYERVSSFKSYYHGGLVAGLNVWLEDFAEYKKTLTD